MATYEMNIDTLNASLSFYQAEKYIYGSSRLGMLKDSVNVLGSAFGNTDSSNVIHTLGNKRYELSNHLGNVLTVITDKPIPHGNGGTVDYFMADIKSSQDYSPFGVTLSGRNFNSDSSYRFGFNSMERDDEIKGRGNSYNYTYRMHDPRLGRFFAVDPLADNFSSNSSYSFAMNSVIKFKELEGLELYVCGTNSDEFINLLSARTGLEFSKNPNGMLVVTTTILRIPNIFNPSEIIETPIPNVNSSDNISMTLRKVVFAVTVGVDNNGNKLEVVDVMASSSSEIAKINSTGVDDVLFDSFRTEKSEKNATADMVDMADFEAIANYPELQSALLGHFLSERAASKNYEEGHKQGLVIELEVMQEKYKNAVVRNNESLTKYMNRPLDNMGFEGKLTGYAFDYGEVMFLFVVGDDKINDNKEIFNPNKVNGAIEVK